MLDMDPIFQKYLDISSSLGVKRQVEHISKYDLHEVENKFDL